MAFVVMHKIQLAFGGLKSSLKQGAWKRTRFAPGLSLNGHHRGPHTTVQTIMRVQMYACVCVYIYR